MEVPDHERADKARDQARPPERRSRLPPDAGRARRSLPVFRVSEVVRLRGTGADSLYQQRPAALLDVPGVRRPGSELGARRVGVVVRPAVVPGILAQAFGNSRRARILCGIHRNGHHHPVHAGRLGRSCGRGCSHDWQCAVSHERGTPPRLILLPAEARRRKSRRIGAADRARPGACGAEADTVRSAKPSLDNYRLQGECIGGPVMGSSFWDKVRRTRYRVVEVDGLKIFYREAGADTSPALLLLHGFPTSSHMFRDLIPALADDYHVVAPDLPGFGFSDAPDRTQFRYTFDHLADVIDRFTTVAGLNRYAVYVFDYGAPVGFRLATHHPERITAIISQNGNAYEEGLSGGWNPIQRYWKEPTAENRAALRNFLTPEATKWQYMHGVQDESLVAPESYTLDSALLARPGNDEIQLDLFLDYASNVALYPTFQEYFRTHRPPLLAVWGKNDPFFLPSGAEAFKRDIPSAVVRFFDTGHFALETHAAEIAAAIRGFLAP